MCGIAGIRKLGATPIRNWQITLMANRLEYRGNDATGVALMDRAGNTWWLKNHEPAWSFTSSHQYKQWLAEHLKKDIIVALIHTRKWTKGTCYRNENNHPIVMEKAPAGIIIHNGVILNDDDIFKDNAEENGFERACQTDSDAIRAVLDFHGGISKDTNLIKDLCRLEGAVASALIHPATPDKLLLLRDNNPIMIGTTQDFLFFASDKKAIHAAAKPWIRRHGIIQQLHAPAIAFVPMNNESAWIIGDKGIEWHQQFKCAGNNYGRGNTLYRDQLDFHDKRERAKRLAAEPPAIVKAADLVGLVTSMPKPHYVLCMGKGCFRHLPLNEEQRKVISTLRCKHCKTPLSTSIPAFRKTEERGAAGPEMVVH